MTGRSRDGPRGFIKVEYQMVKLTEPSFFLASFMHL